jgi:hypothetical protein
MVSPPQKKRPPLFASGDGLILQVLSQQADRTSTPGAPTHHYRYYYSSP